MVESQNIMQNIKYLSFKDGENGRKKVAVSELANNKCCYTITVNGGAKQFRGKLVGIEALIDEPGVRVKLANLLQDTEFLTGELYGIPGNELRVDVHDLKYIE